MGADGGALLPEVRRQPPSSGKGDTVVWGQQGTGNVGHHPEESRGRCWLQWDGGDWGPTGVRGEAAVSSSTPLLRRALHTEYRVRLGALHLGPASPRVLSVPVRRVLLPPDYSKDGARGDLALLQLRHPVPLSSQVQPVCLPEPGARLPPGTRCWVTGWGSLHPGGEAEGGTRGAREEGQEFPPPPPSE